PHRSSDSFPTRRSSDLGLFVCASALPGCPTYCGHLSPRLRFLGEGGSARGFGRAGLVAGTGEFFARVLLTLESGGANVETPFPADRKSTRLNSSHGSIS